MGRLSGLAATLLACVTACGDDGVHHLPDGPTVADGSVVDATPSGDVTVTTLARCCVVAPGTPVAAVPVFVVQPDGTLGTGGATGADGKLTLHGVVSGAAITAVYPENVDQRSYLVTTIGVKPGDSLTYGDSYYSAPTNGTAGTMTVTVPALANATYFYAYTPCGQTYSSTPVLTVTQYDYCQVPTAPLVTVAYSNTGPIATGYVPAASYANNGSVAAPAWVAYPAQNFTATVSGLGAEVRGAYLNVFALAGNAQLGTSNFGEPTPTHTVSSMFSVPKLAKTYAYARLLRDDRSLGEHYAYSTGAADATSIMLAAPTTMPWVGGFTASAAIGRATWLQTEGTSYDAAVLSFNWNHVVADVSHHFSWNVIVPPGVTELDFGKPPTALAAFLPTDVDSLYGNVKLVDLSTASSYDALRAVPEWQSVSPDQAVIAGDQPTAGVGYEGGGGGGGSGVRD